MKTLASLAFLAALAVPAAAQVADTNKDPAKAGDTTELKKKYSGRKGPGTSQLRAVQGDQRGGQAAAASGRAYDGGAAPASDPSAAPATPAGLIGGRPLLYMHMIKGSGGFTIKQLTENLDWTEKNITALEDFIHPYKQGEEPAKGDDLAWAHKSLEQESAIAASLIADGDAALAKGIQREGKDDIGARFAAMHISRAMRAYLNPTPDEITEIVASRRGNVAGWISCVIKLKTLNQPDAKDEAQAEGYLESARKLLSEREKIEQKPK